MRECPHCSSDLTKVYHTGSCPKVKSVEYYENGKVKKVEFHDHPEFPYWPTTQSENFDYTVQWLIS